MAKTTTSLETPLRAQLDRLAEFEPTALPVISLYLDMRPDQNGRRQYEAFLRRALAERQATYGTGPERESFDRDIERINEWLAEDVERSANGLAIFACHGASLFETIQMTAPIDNHWLFVASVPHLYPLARVNDQYPRYAALLVDTNSARLFVFSLGDTAARREVKGVKTRRTTMGGWSQARYQRHVENFHMQHMKEVIDVLDRVVRDESITQLVLSCDETSRPLLMDQLPKHLTEKIVDIVPMGIRTAEHEVLSETLEALRAKDAESDQQHVEEIIGAWRAGGLAVTGPEETLRALEMGQVEELVIAASPDALRATSKTANGNGDLEVETSAPGAASPERLTLADDLVTKAHLTSARIRFIEQADLLKDVGGVGARLRFKI
jgi:peptide chain release factor subunit 1